MSQNRFTNTWQRGATPAASVCPRASKGANKPKGEGKGKGEIMIIGTQTQIMEFVVSQSEFVGEDKDVNGAIACISMTDIERLPSRIKGKSITGVNHKNERDTFKFGSQSDWFQDGWKDDIKRALMISGFTGLYVMGVFFKNNSRDNVHDGNIFIGGTQDPGEDFLTTAKRELGEEVGLIINEGSALYELPTRMSNKKIWIVNACNISKEI